MAASDSIYWCIPNDEIGSPFAYETDIEVHVDRIVTNATTGIEYRVTEVGDFPPQPEPEIPEGMAAVLHVDQVTDQQRS